MQDYHSNGVDPAHLTSFDPSPPLPGTILRQPPVLPVRLQSYDISTSPTTQSPPAPSLGLDIRTSRSTSSNRRSSSATRNTSQSAVNRRNSSQPGHRIASHSRGPATGLNNGEDTGYTSSPRGGIVLNLPGLLIDETAKRGRPVQRRGDDEASNGGGASHSRSRSVAKSRGISSARDPSRDSARNRNYDYDEEEQDDDELEAIDEVKPAIKRVKVGARASIACSTCRKRKVRCSGEWPTCTFCSGRGMECVYDGHPAEFAPTFETIKPFEIILPPVAIIIQALDYFFLHNYDTFYFFHRPSLTNAITNGTAEKELVCCILAFAARSCQALRDLHPTISAPEYYASLAIQGLQQPNLSYSSSSTTSPSHSPTHPGTVPTSPEAKPRFANAEVSLVRCQCNLMLGLFECTGADADSGWMRVGASIRMAQILRLGYEDDVEDGTRRLDPTLSEIRRRTFWCCYLLDRLVTDGRDRPVSLQAPHSSSIRLPGNDAEFNLNQAITPGARFEPAPAPWSIPSSMESSLSHHVEADLYGHILRISEIWQKVATYIGAGGRNSDRRPPWLIESTFALLANELLIFDVTLPVQFRYNDSNLIAHSLVNQGRHYGLLHLLFYTSTLVLHRDYLPFLPTVDFDVKNGPIDGSPLYGQFQVPQDWWSSCLDRAINAANVISDLATRLQDLGSQITHPFAGFTILAAATLHLHVKFWPQSSRALFDVNHYVNQDHALLNALRPLYPIAISWCEGFNKLYQLYQNIIQRGENLINVDPRQVRSSVIKMLRTVEEDHHAQAPPLDGLMRGQENGGFVPINNQVAWPYSTLIPTTTSSSEEELGLIGLSGLDLSGGHGFSLADEYSNNYSQGMNSSSSSLYHSRNDNGGIGSSNNNMDESFSHWFDFNLK